MGIFPDEIGGKSFSHIETGADIRPKKRRRKITASALNPFAELSPNLYYSQRTKIRRFIYFLIK
jgi:hypothetical protein